MIPSDPFLLDGDTAWLIHDDAPLATPLHWQQLDRPCDACGGTEQGHPDDGGVGHACQHCIDGRHTFDIEVPHPDGPCDHIRLSCDDIGCEGPIKTYRVSIIPGMVLPIVRHHVKGWHIYQSGRGRHWLVEPNERKSVVILPHAAAPGMWAVRLRVAS